MTLFAWIVVSVVAYIFAALATAALLGRRLRARTLPLIENRDAGTPRKSAPTSPTHGG